MSSEPPEDDSHPGREARLPEVAPAPGPPAAQQSLAGGRLHPAALVLWPTTRLLPLLVLIAAGRLPAAVAAVLILGALVVTPLRWWRFTWRLERDALVIEQGLLQRQRRVLPLERIQGVDVVRKLRHRLLGVAEVRVEVVGGRMTEGRLDALSAGEAERLRGLLLGHEEQDPDGEAGERGEVLARLRPAHLVAAGLTGGRVGVIAAMAGAAEQLFGERLAALFERVPGLLGDAAALRVLLVTAVIVFALSVLVTVVVHWDFTLIRDDEELRVRQGLLEQRVQTLPLRRVQAVRLEENLLRRLFGLSAVLVDVAGRSGGQDVRDTGLLLPLGRRATGLALAAAVLGRPDLADVRLSPMPPAARRRRLVRALAPVALATPVAALLAGPAWLLLGVLGLPAAAAAIDSYRALGHARAGDVLVVRAGWLVRRTTFVPVAALQGAVLRASPLQRLRDLATVTLLVARSPGGRDARMVDAGPGTARAALWTAAGEPVGPGEPAVAADAEPSARVTSAGKAGGGDAGPGDIPDRQDR